MWNELGLSIVCDIYKRYSTHYSIRLLAYIAHNQMKYSKKFQQLTNTPKGISCLESNLYIFAHTVPSFHSIL